MAIDLGSTNLKAAIYDLRGNCAASASRKTEKIHPNAEHPEWAVWDPQQIWLGVAAAAREAIGKIDDPTDIRAVAVTGMGMDGVPMDEDGAVLYPFISWHDPRTEAQAAWWKREVGEERTFSITGFPSWPITSVMRMLWIKEHEPEIMTSAHKWLLIEDYLNHKLCGAWATDYSMASCTLLFDQCRRRWSDELLEAAGIEPRLLPEPRPSGTPLGEVHANAAKATGLPEGTLVVLGGHDHLCGTIPVGAFRPGTLLDLVGTWESVIAPLQAPVLTREVHAAAVCVQSHVVENLYAAWGGSPAGDSLEWFVREFASHAGTDENETWASLAAGLEGTKAGAAGVVYLPHLSAAGCPIDDSRSMGAFAGLSNRATRFDMLRAIVEGLNYQFMDIVDALEDSLGCRFDDVVVAGGGAKNAFAMQNKADITGRTIQVSEIEDATPLGAAVLAGLGAGCYADIDEAYEAIKRPTRCFEPQSALTDAYSEYRTLYREMYPALKSLHHRIFDVFCR